MRYLIAAAGVLCLFLSGCGVERVAIDPVGYKSVKQGAEITQEQADQIQDGKTTKDEVYLMFGEPSSILEEGHIFVYDWVRGGEGNVLGFGTGEATAHSLIVTFSDDTIATAHKITRGKVRAAETGG
jgi:outer membrane protein assembly factor BamE (lipoprotein component of BamABCDE complex)